jgi:hypothetical protein
MGFICKLPLMFSLYKHSAIRICCGYRLFHSFTTGGVLGIVIILIIFNGLLTQLFSLCVDLTAQLAGVDFRCFLYLFLLVLLLVGAGFDVGAINED